jgi:hypothetical protein
VVCCSGVTKMRMNRAVIVGLLLLGSTMPGLAQQQPQQNADQMQVEQQACENDVYALCGEAIPDQNRIEKCLRSKWSTVSKKCRSVMASYGRRHKGHDGH